MRVATCAIARIPRQIKNNRDRVRIADTPVHNRLERPTRALIAGVIAAVTALVGVAGTSGVVVDDDDAAVSTDGLLGVRDGGNGILAARFCASRSSSSSSWIKAPGIVLRTLRGEPDVVDVVSAREDDDAAVSVLLEAEATGG